MFRRFREKEVSQQQLLLRMMSGRISWLYHCDRCGRTVAADNCPASCAHCGGGSLRSASAMERDAYFRSALARLSADARPAA